MSGENEQIPTVMNMHAVPRFGHSSSIALLASYNPEERSDYTGGVIAFSVFLFTLLISWGSVLLVLKFMSSEKVGCANGGGVIDIGELRKSDGPRPGSKAMIRRKWRLHPIFMMCSVLIPVASFLYLQNGLIPVEESLLDAAETIEGVKDLVYEADDIISQLLFAQEEMNESEAKTYMDIGKYCQNAETSSVVNDLGLQSAGDDIIVALKTIDEFMLTNVRNAKLAINRALDVTSFLESVIEWVYENDWRPKMLLLCLNVVNIFLLIGACLSRHDKIHYPFHCLISYLLIPGFIVMLFLSVVATCGFAMGTVMNAGGGDGPEGTVEEILVNRGVLEGDLSYQMLEYYQNQCETDNPLKSVAPDEKELLATINAGHTFLSGSEAYETDLLDDECGADITPVIEAAKTLLKNLGVVVTQSRRAMLLTSCYKVNPVRKRILYGSTCDESVNGMTWMFATVLAISILSMTMLSVRASLYNAVIRPSKEKQTEVEWEDYKQYMSRYYDDVDEWKQSGSGQDKDGGIGHIGSFETDLTMNPSSDSEDAVLSPDSHEDEGEETLPDVTPTRVADFSERTRELLHVLDEEILPLSPEPVPLAPKKKIPALRRTNIGKLC